jgi:hypothetical protein
MKPGKLPRRRLADGDPPFRFNPLQVAAPVRGHIFSAFSSKNLFIFHAIKLSRICRPVSSICTFLSHE